MSTPSPIVRLPLVAMAAVLAALTIVALLLATDSALRHWGWWRLAFFALPVVVAVYYLNEYRKLPYEPWHFFPARPAPEPTPPAPPPPSVATQALTPPPAAVAGPAPEEEPDDQPFVDPVEEADRLAQEKGSAEPDDPNAPRLD